MNGREVTLVVCDRDGGVIGELSPFLVPTPWWPDVAPIQQRFPQLAVLRLLDGRPAPGVPGAQVRYLAQLLDNSNRPGPLLPTDETPAVDQSGLRMPWAQPGGPHADLAWAEANFETLAPPLQQRTWNLSSIWTCFGPEHPLWLKCVPPFFAHEGPVLERLQGRGVPQLVAYEGRRLLLGEMPGVDGFGCSEEEARLLMERLVALQAGTAPEVGELARLGVPDARWGVLVDQLQLLVRRRAPEDANLARLLETAPARVAAIDSCGLPDVLVHGDAHPGTLASATSSSGLTGVTRGWAIPCWTWPWPKRCPPVPVRR